MLKCSLIFLLLTITKTCVAYKILVFIPLYGISHIRFAGKLADVLANAGHEVAVYQPVLDKSIKFRGFVSPNITKYYTLPRNPGDYPSFVKEETFARLWEGMPIRTVFNFFQARNEFCEGIMNDKTNIDALKAENFDLVVLEWIEPCGYGLIRAIGVKKYVTTWSGGMDLVITKALGVKPHWSYAPLYVSAFTEVLSFFERFVNFIGYWFAELVWVPFMLHGVNGVIKRDFPEFDVSTALTKSAFVFVNAEDYVDYVIPRTPKVVLISNIDNTVPKPLTGHIAEIIESPKSQGFILFSLGSFLPTSSMPPHVKSAFLDAFKAFPDITFLWKYETPEDGTAETISNVYLDKWLPQRDLLHHPKILAFITHGGQNSLNEAAAAGVPLISMPVFADQPRNTGLIKYRGFGLGLDYTTLTKDKVIEAIQEILTNKTYKERIQLTSQMIKARPFSTKEAFIRHIEFAAKFGDTNVLSTQGVNQNFIVFYSLDVIGFCLVLVLLAGLFLKRTIFLLYNYYWVMLLWKKIPRLIFAQRKTCDKVEDVNLQIKDTKKNK